MGSMPSRWLMPAQTPDRYLVVHIAVQLPVSPLFLDVGSIGLAVVRGFLAFDELFRAAKDIDHVVHVGVHYHLLAVLDAFGKHFRDPAFDVLHDLIPSFGRGEIAADRFEIFLEFLIGLFFDVKNQPSDIYSYGLIHFTSVLAVLFTALTSSCQVFDSSLRNSLPTGLMA